MSLTTFFLNNYSPPPGNGVSNDYIYISDNDGLHFGTGNFDIEWVMDFSFNYSTWKTRIFGIAGYQVYYFSNNNYDVDRAMYINNGTQYGPYTTSFASFNNVFAKYKISRVSGTTKLYVNDIEALSFSDTYDFTSGDFYFGRHNAEGDTCIHGDILYFKITYGGVVQLLVEPTGISGAMTTPINYVHYVHNGSDTQALSPLPFTVRSVPDVWANGYIPCFGEGTQILTIENEEEKYVAVEKLVEGSVVKTYRHGARKIAKIVSGSFINDPQEPKRCMYKLPKTDAMTNDLMLTGGHAVLVDESPKGLQFKIDDKYLSFAENNADFVKIDNHQIYKYYNFSMENDGDKDRRFGVWANGVLCETPSEKQLESFEL